MMNEKMNETMENSGNLNNSLLQPNSLIFIPEKSQTQNQDQLNLGK